MRNIRMRYLLNYTYTLETFALVAVTCHALSCTLEIRISSMIYIPCGHGRETNGLGSFDVYKEWPFGLALPSPSYTAVI